MRPLAESCSTNHRLTELIILRLFGFRGLQPCRFSTLCRTVLSASQRPFSVAGRLEGKAWRAVTHHATRFSTKGAASSSAASEDAGCAKYECPHVWIGSALAQSNPTLTAPLHSAFFSGAAGHTFQMEVQKRLGSLTRDEDLLFTCTYILSPQSWLPCYPSRHPGCSEFGLKSLL